MIENDAAAHGWKKIGIIVGCAALAACGASRGGDGNEDGTPGSDGGGDAPGFAVPGTGGGGALQPPAPGSMDPTKVCGQETLPLERLPGELLLVLDRSTSMVIDRLQDQTHWTVTTAAIDTVLRDTQAGVMWGLKTFPSTFACNVRPGVEHEVALNNHAAISATIAMAMPGNSNGTPTTAAMTAARQYLQTRQTANPKFILLATDGEPTCMSNTNAPDHMAAIASVAEAAAAGFHTFVIGIAAQRQSGQALQTLNAMAEAGKEPRAGDVKFYSVSSQMELTNALGAIAGQVGSCTFPLSKAPPSPDDVAVRADGERVPRSSAMGWEYGPNQRSIVLHGDLCTKAKAGMIKDVKITFGCPGMVVL